MSGAAPPESRIVFTARGRRRQGLTGKQARAIRAKPKAERTDAERKALAEFDAAIRRILEMTRRAGERMERDFEHEFSRLGVSPHRRGRYDDWTAAELRALRPRTAPLVARSRTAPRRRGAGRPASRGSQGNRSGSSGDDGPSEARRHHLYVQKPNRHGVPGPRRRRPRALAALV